MPCVQQAVLPRLYARWTGSCGRNHCIESSGALLQHEACVNGVATPPASNIQTCLAAALLHDLDVRVGSDVLQALCEYGPERAKARLKCALELVEHRYNLVFGHR